MKGSWEVVVGDVNSCLQKRAGDGLFLELIHGLSFKKSFGSTSRVSESSRCSHGFECYTKASSA
jgi:hypothetical protein